MFIILSIFSESLKRVLKEATTAAVENAIKVWLKHAPQRLKLATAKAEKNRQ